ncbi:MAG: YihY/virulence factor BrkB family protein [Gimesia chilikensis]|uniref:YihY/virulence factor BrkB family protein n=1 Tax=Gimesia chilikensis TaxID=2605989 RepID=UPI0011EFF6AD|nr:YihY/virulence factor BrkB family protein [Gimesia chilikensis]KAA0140583.1 YihY/virulence factor BrkB family protein [Gimesia chilikensis]
MDYQKLRNVLKRTGSDFLDDECMSSGAAIAYYTIFSLPPLLAIVFALTTQFWSAEQVSSVINSQLGLPVEQSVEAEDDADTSAGFDLTSVAERVQSGQTPERPLWSRLLGAVVLIFSASGVLAQLQSALNKAWNVEPDPEQGGIMAFIKKRLISLAFLIVVGLLLLISLVLTTFVDEFTRWLDYGYLDVGILSAVMIVNTLLTLGLATLLFAATFKVLPDANIRWRDVFMGAAVTAILFTIGKSGIAWYLQFSEAGSSWGSAATSMIGILIWVYYSSLIILLGAEFTQSWSIEFGDGLKPAPGAVLVTAEKIYHRNETKNLSYKS